jgi:hypothetical protein
MPDDDQDEKLPPINLSNIARAALDDDPGTEADAEPDPSWLRWLKFTSIVIIPAVFVGVIFMGGDFIQARHEATTNPMHQHRYTEEQAGKILKRHFFIGAGVGGSLGLIYVVRCIIRKTDP